MKHTIAKRILSGAAAGSVLISGAAVAIDWNVTGLVRQEIAYSLSSGNPNNNWSSKFNNRIAPHMTHAGFGAGAASPIDPRTGLPSLSNANAPSTLSVDARGNVGGLFANGFATANGGPGFLPAGLNTATPVDCHFSMQRAVAAGAPGLGNRVLAGTDNGVMFPTNGFPGACPGGGAGFASPGQIPNSALPPSGRSEDLDFNAFNTRLEIDVQANISHEFSAYMKFRAYFDGTRHFTDGKIDDNFGSSAFFGSRMGTRTEWNSPDFILDIPALYLDWNRGPLWLRVGNQVIAWGEAYFFRTHDVANGLDLRRHFILNPGAEEYQDQRIGAPGVRLSYTFENNWEFDGFVQMFQPSVLPGFNTAYNLVAAGRLLETDGIDDAENALNYGFRMTMPFTDSFTGILGWVNRRNPDGVVRHTDSPTTWTSGVNTGCLNAHNDTLNLVASTFGTTTVAATNAALDAAGFTPMPALDTRAVTMANGCGSPFLPDPTGGMSLEHFEVLERNRVDQVRYISNTLSDWPAAKWSVRDMFGFGEETNYVDSLRTVDGFRSSFGPFIGFVEREFKRENIFMIGGNYLVTSDNQWLDQLIIRGEVAVTPDKRLTNDLRIHFTHATDVVSALIFEKYHRISEAFPATYFVTQWMHRTRTDMFGRDLEKNGTPSIDKFVDPDTGNFLPAAFDPEGMTPEGSSSANYVVFAFQQPFPNLIWRFDFAVLVDVAGGYLVQPGVRYRPAANWQWDLYATVIGSPGGDNDTITETIDFADEVFARLTYFF